MNRIIIKFTLYLVVLLLLAPFPTTYGQISGPDGAPGIKVGFYANSCPQAEAITTSVINDAIHRDPSLGASLLRMFAHDCFLRGCDGSILLNSTEDNAEKDSAINSRSVRGYDIIDAAKDAIEKACPGVVSCADILAWSSRDATAALGGPTWEVEGGRRDGVISLMDEVADNTPSPFEDIVILKDRFTSKGLNAKDLVVLSASHNVGRSHCSSFINRLYEFNNQDVNSGDPSLDPGYMQDLRKKCPFNGPDEVVEMDPGFPNTFDDGYFNLVLTGKGLFTSDQALMDDPETKAYIEDHKAGKKVEFFQDFATSMIRTARIGVLTGTEGEIRKVCSNINGQVPA